MALCVGLRLLCQKPDLGVLVVAYYSDAPRASGDISVARCGVQCEPLPGGARLVIGPFRKDVLHLGMAVLRTMAADKAVCCVHSQQFVIMDDADFNTTLGFAPAPAPAPALPAPPAHLNPHQRNLSQRRSPPRRPRHPTEALAGLRPYVDWAMDAHAGPLYCSCAWRGGCMEMTATTEFRGSATPVFPGGVVHTPVGAVAFDTALDICLSATDTPLRRVTDITPQEVSEMVRGSENWPDLSGPEP